MAITEPGIPSPSDKSSRAPLRLRVEDDPVIHRRRIRVAAVATVVSDHAVGLFVFALLAAATAISVALARPQKFVASATVSPVGNARQLNLPAGIASSLLGNANAGIQATPAFVARLVRLRGVLDEVAQHKMPGGTQTVIERLSRKPASAVPPYKAAEELDKKLQTTIDRESGTVTITSALADSALARTIVNLVIDGISRTYTRAMKSQANALVEAQAARVDSAAYRVHQAEAALVNFGAANRIVSNASPVWIEQQRLQNNVAISQSIYTQAVTELENARGKAIEDAPALVVLDPVPNALMPRKRMLALLGSAAFLGALLLGIAFVLTREAAANVYAEADRDAARLISSLERLPLGGRRIVRWFVRA